LSFSILQPDYVFAGVVVPEAGGVVLDDFEESEVF
jgi:hypothetical protein